MCVPQISSPQLTAVGRRDPPSEHQSSRPDLQPAAGAPADHPGEIHGLQGPRDLLPAQVSELSERERFAKQVRPLTVSFI